MEPRAPGVAPGGRAPSVLLATPEGLRSVYQPVVDLRAGEVVGYEAFTRVAEWPGRSPEPWFAAAGRQGLGGQIEAAALLSALRARPLLGPGQFLSVNVSAAALLDRAVTGVLLGERNLAGLVVELGDPQDVDPGRLAATLDALHEHGLLLCLRVTDGGRRELRRLADLGPDLVELGADLVGGIAGDHVAQRVAHLVRALAHDLGAEVLAAGVEALEDARWLQRAGTRMAQGWLFGRPRAGLMSPSPEVVSWLRVVADEEAGPRDA